MGRTKRKRKHRKRDFHTCDDREDIKYLNSWLAHHGLRCNGKLVLSIFNNTGRGLLTKKKIHAGDELMNLPLNLTINVCSLLADHNFCNIFSENKIKCFIEYRQKLSFQSVLSFYLCYLKIQGPNSKWFVYLESLPKNYTVPYFLPNDVKFHLDTEIQSVISNQNDVINFSYLIFTKILENNSSCDSGISMLRQRFSKNIYEWAYFTVNTRCVYMDLTKIVDFKATNGTIFDLICENTNISLCPYLDMINHNPNAKNETKLLVSNNTKYISVSNINEDLLKGISFSIYTKNSFCPYSEVFICYGDSHNLKLITEYGFFIPENELDCVNFEFSDIQSFLHSKESNLTDDQVCFITSHRLNKDLYIDGSGLSFHLYALLMVIKYYYRKDMDISRLIYSAAMRSNDSSLNEVIIPMVVSKLDGIKGSISKLRNYKQCVILSNCVALMCQYVEILEKFIKC